MYSCFIWCEFIDLVGFFGCYCVTPVNSTLFYFSYMQSLACNATPTPLWENIHNTLVTWAWGAYEETLRNVGLFSVVEIFVILRGL